jgi:hypothetical protein
MFDFASAASVKQLIQAGRYLHLIFSSGNSPAPRSRNCVLRAALDFARKRWYFFLQIVRVMYAANH